MLPQRFGSHKLVRIIPNICFWVGMALHRGALSFAFYPETMQPCVACGDHHLNEHGSTYLSSWLQCGIGLTWQSTWAPPFLKRGRGNLCDKCIYFSTGCLPAGLAGSGCWNSVGWLLHWEASRRAAASSGRTTLLTCHLTLPALLQGLAWLWESLQGLMGKGRLASSLWIIHYSREDFSLCGKGQHLTVLGLGRTLRALQPPGPDSWENLILEKLLSLFQNTQHLMHKQSQYLLLVSSALSS